MEVATSTVLLGCLLFVIIVLALVALPAFKVTAASAFGVQNDDDR